LLDPWVIGLPEVDATMELMGLDPANKTPAGRYSLGMRQRLGLAQAIMEKPRLLLLDEPDSGVDVESLKLIGEEIQKYVQKNKASALVITHQGDILEYLKARKACVLLDSTIHCHNKPEVILADIRRRGYRQCVKCWEGKTAK